MDKITKTTFLAWVEENDWLKVGTGKNPEGFDQDTFLTPAGQVLFAIYDTEGNVRNVAVPMAAPMAPPPRMPMRGPLDLTGGSQFPPIR